jgi:hypothetical protein
LGSSIIPKEVVAFQAWNSVNWNTIEGNSDLSKLARKELDAAIRAEIKTLKPVTNDQIEEALLKVQQEDDQIIGLMNKAKSLVIEKGKNKIAEKKISCKKNFCEKTRTCLNSLK